VNTKRPRLTQINDSHTQNDWTEHRGPGIKKGTETLASLVYSRDKDGGVTKATSKGLPGEEKLSFSYDESSRLTKGAGVNYKYDAANNLTTIEKTTYAYNAASELESATLKKAATATYSYNEVGQRTKTTPASGPATSYGYDQAGNLTTVTRAKEGETPAIEDTYNYNGEGLRTSQTIAGTTTHLAWDVAEEIPLILNDGTYSYIYGPDDLPIEQINNATGTVSYLHHDQAGSTRLITGSTGTVTGKCTYGAYGAPTCEGTTTTPLGYDGQDTNEDTGLIYLRNRVYDPATAQFLTVDPTESISGAPYNYAGDNPINREDAVGLLWTPVAGGAAGADAVCGATVEIPGVDIGTCGAAGISTGIAAAGAAIGVVTAVAGNEGGDEGEAELHAKEAERENCGNPAEPPGPGWKWHGNSDAPEGSDEGAWVNPETGETLHPDLGHGEPIGPHYDYTAPDGSQYRIYPDGRIEPTNP
jgi:RHS repeat-associated protein